MTALLILVLPSLTGSHSQNNTKVSKKRGYNTRVFLFITFAISRCQITTKTMPYNHTKKLVLLCSLITLSSPGHAIDIQVSGELMHFDYEEIDPQGNSLNREKGWIPGLTFSGLQQYNSITNTLALSIFDGQVDYNGQTQAGQPHQTTTEETILKLMYRLGWSPASTQAAFYGSAY